VQAIRQRLAGSSTLSTPAGKTIEEEKEGRRKVTMERHSSSSEHRKVVVVKEQMATRVAVVAEIKEEGKGGPEEAKIPPLYIGIKIEDEGKLKEIIRDTIAQVAASVG
jgi:hypothetical protein